MGHRALVAAAAATALVLAAPGCGGDGGGGGDTTAVTTPTATQAGGGGGGIGLQKLGDFESPLYVTQPPGSEDLYVVERDGRVKIVRDGETLGDPFIDISDKVSTDVEQGLLSIAFAPDYESSGLLYAYYTDKQGSQRIVELVRDPGDPDRVAGGERLVLKMADYAPNHNGGLIVFGSDGHLYVGTGDGGGSGDPRRNAQNLGALLGKLLRIDPQQAGGKPYTVPADNPFVGKPGARPEIYSYGLRNPWRFAFDSKTGDLVIADVGQDEFEEVDIVGPGKGAGANFGWSALEGDAPFNEDQSAPGAVKPALVYEHSQGCSITGGYVVHDPELPALEGRFVYGDFCAPKLRSFQLAGTKAVGDKPLGPEVPGTSSFGTDNAGHIYVASFNGPVYRLVAE
ncbi:MAG: PQQ-dependent sugar dehydrogenase [Solirubrobacterales bacterium]